MCFLSMMIFINLVYYYHARFLACTKVELLDLSVWIAMGKTFAYNDLDLDPTMPNIKLVSAMFVYDYVFKIFLD